MLMEINHVGEVRIDVIITLKVAVGKYVGR